MEIIAIGERLCDFCNDALTSESHTVSKSFILTDWGAICIQCWDTKVVHHRDFHVLGIYAKSWKLEDAWVKQPILIDF